MRLPWVAGVVALSALINYGASGETGWGGIGYLFLFGFMPMLLLIACFLVSLFITAAPWRQKLFTAIAIGYGLLLPFIGVGLHLPVMNFLWPSIFWLAPLAVWYGMAMCLSFRRKNRTKK